MDNNAGSVRDALFAICILAAGASCRAHELKVPMDQTTLEPLARKLGVHSPISAEEREALLSLPFSRRSVHAHAQLFHRTDPARHCCVLLDGYAGRYKLLRDGSRQILAVLMRGDSVGLQRALFGRADHSVEMLTGGVVASISVADLEELLSAHPRLMRVLWSDTLFDGAIQREWILNVGRRSALARLAHLVCEMGVRHEQQGIGRRDEFDLPLTQSHVADCTGLTAVHVNRTLRALDERKLVNKSRGKVSVGDWASLANVAGFDAQYLLADLSGPQL